MKARGEYAKRLTMGRVLESWRLNAGLTQREASERSGIGTATTISALELGRNTLGPDRAEALLSAYGVPHAYGFAVIAILTYAPWIDPPE